MIDQIVSTDNWRTALNSGDRVKTIKGIEKGGRQQEDKDDATKKSKRAAQVSEKACNKHGRTKSREETHKDMIVASENPGTGVNRRGEGR
jgi:hypothetical protein